MIDKGGMKQHPEFSLVKGGLVYRFFRWAGLYNSELEPVYIYAVVIPAIAWLPLLLLSFLDGRALGGVKISFLSDIEHHARFLVALPLLLSAETFVHRVLSPRIGNFVRRRIIRNGELPKFEAAIASAHRMRDSIFPELILIGLVYMVGLRFYGNQMASASSLSATWYATPDGVHWNLTPAGYWLVIFALPLFQFLLARWYWRIFIWVVFLFRVSRLDLNLVPTHADRVAGLGFLNKCIYSFSYFLLAHGALLSGYIAGQVMHFGGDPRGYKLEAAAVLIFLLFVVLAPLALLTPRLISSKWERGGAFGALTSRYVEGFDEKWITGNPPEGETLLGTGDIQSLADIGNSYTVVSQMRIVPFSTSDILFLAAMVLAPLLPLLLFVFSIEELLDSVLKILM
jgi:hypothetical protein